jgi:hypothetical protein
MSDEIFGDSRRALEEAFFARENEALRRRLREMDEAKRTKEALSAASGITDDAVLEKLLALQVSSETLAALSLIPLVAVAWADGSIDDKERAAVFSRATEVGVRKEDVSHELFERWLTEPPPATLVAAWKDYIRAFVQTMSHEDRRAFKTEFLNRARGIAEAAGGFLGIGRKVSPPEQSVLNDLERAFPD